LLSFAAYGVKRASSRVKGRSRRGFNARKGFGLRSLSRMKLTECARIHDRHCDLSGTCFGDPGVEICPRVLQLGLVVSRIEFNERRSRIDELVVLDSRIEPVRL